MSICLCFRWLAGQRFAVFISESVGNVFNYYRSATPSSKFWLQTVNFKRQFLLLAWLAGNTGAWNTYISKKPTIDNHIKIPPMQNN